jgi:hypothetical protein
MTDRTAKLCTRALCILFGAESDEREAFKKDLNSSSTEIFDILRMRQGQDRHQEALSSKLRSRLITSRFDQKMGCMKAKEPSQRARRDPESAGI